MLIGGGDMVWILERIGIFLVTYGRTCAPFRGWGVRGRFLGLVLFGAAMVLQLARIAVLDRSALACLAHFVGGNAGEDEEGEVDDPGSMMLATCHPLIFQGRARD